MALRVEEHHPILTPVLSTRQQNKSRAAFRVKGVRDLKINRLSVRTASSC